MERETEIKKVKVKVLRQEGDAALVEWRNRDIPRRVMVPVSEVDGQGWITKESLDAGMEYGLPWAGMVGRLSATPKKLERALHNDGIWTAQDFLHRWRKVQQIFARLVKPDMVKLLNMVKEETKNA